MSYIFRTIAMSLTLTCLAAPSVIAAEPQAPMTASHHDAATEIRQVVLDMWTAVEAGDVEAYIAHIHPDYTLFGESDIYLQSGKALEHASYSDYLGRYENIRTFMHQPSITVRGDTAWMTYYWSDSGTSKADGTRFTSTGKSTRIFTRENGKWLCIHGHFTAVE